MCSEAASTPPDMLLLIVLAHGMEYMVILIECFLIRGMQQRVYYSFGFKTSHGTHLIERAQIPPWHLWALKMRGSTTVSGVVHTSMRGEQDEGFEFQNRASGLKIFVMVKASGVLQAESLVIESSLRSLSTWKNILKRLILPKRVGPKRGNTVRLAVNDTVFLRQVPQIAFLC